MPPVALLSSNGNGPLLTLFLGSITYCDYVVLARAPGSNNWLELTRGNNYSQSEVTVPLLAPPLPTSLPELDGWAIGWSVIYIGYSDNTAEPYNLQAMILQDDKDHLQPSYHEIGSFDAHTKTLESGCVIRIV